MARLLLDRFGVLGVTDEEIDRVLVKRTPEDLRRAAK
jgi:hypothetical protein